MDVCRLKLRIFQRGQTRLNRLIDQIGDQCFKLFSSKCLVKVFWTGRVGSDERQVDRGLSCS